MDLDQPAMFEIILDSPTTVRLLANRPSLTYLDRSQIYRLYLKKKNEKAHCDKYYIDIRVSPILSSSSIISTPQLDAQELTILSKWKQFHPSEQMLTVELVEATESTDMNPIIGEANKVIELSGDNRLNRANIHWNQTNEVELKLNLTFNFVSTQFPFITKTDEANGLPFLLFVNLISKSTAVLFEPFFCQIKLFWPGGADCQMDLDYNSIVMKRASDQRSFTPQSDQTRLRQYKFTSNQIQSVNTKKEILFDLPGQTADPEPVVQLQLQLPEDYLESEAPSSGGFDLGTYNIFNRDYCFYFQPNHGSESFVNVLLKKAKTEVQFKGFFLDRHHYYGFSLKLKRNEELNSFLRSHIDNRLLVTRFELNLNIRKLTSLELNTWRSEERSGVHSAMLEIIFADSKLPPNVLDIRQLHTNCIEVYWISSEKIPEFEIFFKLNCLSSDFPPCYTSANATIPKAILLGPYGEPFKLEISNRLKATGLNLDSASFQVYSFEANAMTEMNKWIRENNLVKEQQQAYRRLLMVNDQTGMTTSHKAALAVGTLALFGAVAYKIL